MLTAEHFTHPAATRTEAERKTLDPAVFAFVVTGAKKLLKSDAGLLALEAEIDRAAARFNTRGLIDPQSPWKTVRLLVSECVAGHPSPEWVADAVVACMAKASIKGAKKSAKKGD